ncbi:MAG: hypothetical protein U0457_18685 [Candidatus Sericytochromatia bacterium]
MSVIFLLAKKQYNFIFRYNPVHLLILKILILTDKKTCGSCDTFLKSTVSSVTSSFEVSFYDRVPPNTAPYLKGIYFESIGELIPLYNY